MHSASLKMVLGGVADGAAVDSTVLEWFFAASGEKAVRLRVIDTLGPSPIPAVGNFEAGRGAAARHSARGAFVHERKPGTGGQSCGRPAIERFVEAADRDYDPIRRMARAAEGVVL